MQLLQEERLGGNSLTFADRCRKAIAKKVGKLFDECEKEYYENARAKNCDMKLVHYVWDVLFRVQKGYSFCRAHTLAYSLVALQEMNLAYRFPTIFWDCACLISDSGGNDIDANNSEDEESEEVIEYDYENSIEEFIDDDNDDEEDEDDEENEEIPVKKKKKKQKTTNYSKIASAIGRLNARDISILPPDVDKSTLTFSPDVVDSVIRYGLRGISKVGDDIVKTIISGRPYVSVEDFLARVKIKKPQMVNLIKSGAFDEFGDRIEIMRKYAMSISDCKKRITMQNMRMLVDFGLIPDEYDFQRRVFNFNKYLKSINKGNKTTYYLDGIAFGFYEKNFDVDLLKVDETGNYSIAATAWKAIYDKQMAIVRPFVQANAADLLTKVNERLMSDVWDKYCKGNISKWEMDSISCYIHPHELSTLQNEVYGISNYNDLPREPEIDYIANIKGKQVPIYRLRRIAGTVLDRDKLKKTVTLLTTEGVVLVKVYGVFPMYDKQISERGADGKKHIIRKSEFTRGNKIVVTGIRTEDCFLAKTYSRTTYPRIERIDEIDENGFATFSNRHDLEGV